MIRRYISTSVPLVIILGLVLLVFILVNIEFCRASDIDNTEYIAIVRVTNNGTSQGTNEVAVFTCNTSNYIDFGAINDSINNTAIRNPSNSDVSYMAAYETGTWSLEIPSINAQENADYMFYMGGDNATGGQNYYSPGQDGATTTDSANMEPGDNFTIAQSLLINTEPESDNSLFYKAGACRGYITDTDNVTVEIIDTGNEETYATITAGDNGFRQLNNGGMTRAGQRFDDFPLLGTITSVQFKLYKDGNPAGTGYARVRRVSDDSILGTIGTLDVSTLTGAATWKTFDTTPVIIDDDDGDIRVLFEYSGGDGANFVKHRVNTTGDSIEGVETYYDGTWHDTSTAETMIVLDVYEKVSVNSTPIDAGFLEVSTIRDGNWLAVQLDGVTSGNITTTVSVPDTDDDWEFLKGYSANFMRSQEFTISGVQRQYIEWEYNSTFSDQSGNNHDVTPTFRTSGSSVNITAELVSFEPVTLARGDEYRLSDDSQIVTTAPDEPDDLTTEGETVTIPGAAAINALLIAGGIPPALFWYLLGGTIALLIGYWTYKQVPSLLLKAILQGSALGMCSLANFFGLWILLFYGIEALCIVVLSKHYSW